jgi:exodeoxyribonuclease V alpha subunit
MNRGQPPSSQATQAPSAYPDSLSGLIERVTFFNEETGYAVLKVLVKGQRDLVTVVGTLPSANAGEWLTAEGFWAQDRQFGMQLRAQQIRCVPPSSREGIEKYLASGLIKGIGPVYAKKLVKHFGEGIFDIIENFSAKLEDVDGIGPGRRRVIKAAWAEQKAIREVMVFLHSHGVGTSRAARIYKTYGDDAIERIRSNPYVLSKDIPGIGFQTADRIAQKVGIPPDSLMRAEAGLDHMLYQAAQEGHCALPRPVIEEQTAKLLEVGAGIVEQALSRSLANGQTVEETIQGEPLIYLPHLRKAEEGIAMALARLEGGGPQYPAIDFGKAAQWCQAKTGKLLAPSQLAAIELALHSRVMVITGGPGVGKTTILNSLLLMLRAKKVRCLLCAPTGRAAKRLTETTGMEAKTIHRLLEPMRGRAGFNRNRENPLECDLLIVDECSMVDVPLMNYLLSAMPSNASLILVGDVDQLPSVGPGLVLSHFIQSRRVPVARLTEVFRQAAHSQIITTAHRVNQGLMPEPNIKNDESDFFFIERKEPLDIADTLIELVQTRLPKKYSSDPILDIQVLCPMNRGTLGVRELNVSLQNALNPVLAGEPVVEKFGWQFRVRDKIMQTENNYDKDVFNGDIGQISKIDPDEREIAVKYDQREVVYSFGELDEIALAYAITIHKAQGSEFPIVVIPIAMQQYLLLQRNLLYTAITRGKKLVVLVGQPKALGMAIRNSSMERRYSGLLARLEMYKQMQP